MASSIFIVFFRCELQMRNTCVLPIIIFIRLSCIGMVKLHIIPLLGFEVACKVYNVCHKIYENYRDFSMRKK